MIRLLRELSPHRRWEAYVVAFVYLFALPVVIVTLAVFATRSVSRSERSDRSQRQIVFQNQKLLRENQRLLLELLRRVDRERP